MTGPITLPSGSSYLTQLVESLSDSGECSIASATSLDFYPQYVPTLNTLIVASYRGSGRAVAEVVNIAGVASLQNGADDGVRGIVRTIKIPAAPTQADCENTALCILNDAVGQAWAGTYRTWSDSLPGGAADIFRCRIRQCGFPRHRSGPNYLANLTNAQITQVTSTTVQVDVGITRGGGLGVEVRAHDYGWGPANDRNLLGRFSTQTFSLPRLARTQNYFLRLYDNSSPHDIHDARLRCMWTIRYE
jgi:hypothetical protein